MVASSWVQCIFFKLIEFLFWATNLALNLRSSASSRLIRFDKCISNWFERCTMFSLSDGGGKITWGSVAIGMTPATICSIIWCQIAGRLVWLISNKLLRVRRSVMSQRNTPQSMVFVCQGIDFLSLKVYLVTFKDWPVWVENRTVKNWKIFAWSASPLQYIKL